MSSYKSLMSASLPFIPPCSPIPAKPVPIGDGWQHEVRFDGYRVQVHKTGKDVTIYSRNGHVFTQRFETIAFMLRELPVASAVLDGEIVANARNGVPDFARLHLHHGAAEGLHLWCFDLLALNGRDWREHALEKRQGRVRALLARFNCPAVRASETFTDGAKLLRVAERMKLEGVVSKRRGTAYRSGECRDWVKVKTAAWRAANRERWRMFERA
jgi:bifunctional non-homologous end joining protein LigD